MITKDDTNRMGKQSGVITILALLIMSALMTMSLGYLSVTEREGLMAKRLVHADQARQAAIAGVRLVAGVLIEDAGGAGTSDSLRENWNLLTFNTSGTEQPYALDSTRGIYFTVNTVDLSGRVKINRSATDNANTDLLVIDLTWYTSQGALRTDLYNNDYMTFSELARASGIGDELGTYLSHYGTDLKVNINTVDQFDNFDAAEPPDILRALVYKTSLSDIPPGCVKGTNGTITSTTRESVRRALVRYRRSGVGGSGGSAYDATTDDWFKDFNINSVASGTASDIGEWCRAAYGGGCTANTMRTYSICYNYARATSEGYFAIISEGYTMKNPADDPTDTTKRENRFKILHIIYRTSSGYQDLYHREWFQTRQDLIDGGYSTSAYEVNNTFHVWDKTI